MRNNLPNKNQLFVNHLNYSSEHQTSKKYEIAAKGIEWIELLLE